MPTISRPIQVGAKNPAKNQDVDAKLLNYVNKKAAKGGWSVRDTDLLVKYAGLNDAPPAIFQPNATKYAKKSEGNVLRPIHKKADDMRQKVVLDKTEFNFSSSTSRDHFVSKMGAWYQKNA